MSRESKPAGMDAVGAAAAIYREVEEGLEMRQSCKLLGCVSRFK
jgi:hypothetical protein